MSASEMKFIPDAFLTFETVAKELARFNVLLKAQSHAKIHLDLSEVTSCDSAGLAFLIEIKRQTESTGARIIIEHMPQTVSSMAAFCGIEQLLLGDKTAYGES